MTPTNNSYGSKTLLMGPYGSGKTHSLRTLLDPRIKEILGHDLKIYAIFTEPSPMNVLQDILPQINWVYSPPALANWSVLESIGKQLNTLTNTQLQGLGKGLPGAYNQFLQIISLCNNFVDSEGRTHGDLSKLGTDSVFWLDSLTGLNKMGKKLVAGQRPILTQPDWGTAMEFLQTFIDTLTCGLRCHFTLCAHTEYAQDDVHSAGAVKLLVSTLGRKLAPVLPTTFSDVVLTQRVGGKFSWSTSSTSADLRTTYLPLSDTIEPSFVQIISAWKKRSA